MFSATQTPVIIALTALARDSDVHLGFEVTFGLKNIELTPVFTPKPTLRQVLETRV